MPSCEACTFREMRGQDLPNCRALASGNSPAFSFPLPCLGWGCVFPSCVLAEENKPKSPCVYDMQNLEKIIEEHRNNGFNDAHTAQLQLKCRYSLFMLRGRIKPLSLTKNVTRTHSRWCSVTPTAPERLRSRACLKHRGGNAGSSVHTTLVVHRV